MDNNNNSLSTTLTTTSSDDELFNKKPTISIAKFDDGNDIAIRKLMICLFTLEIKFIKKHLRRICIRN